MASAYGVFAARGERAEPTPVLRVIDRDGKVIIDNSEPATDAGAGRGRRRQRHRRAAGRAHERHRAGPGHRSARRRQDRHHPEQQGRVVHRLHPHAVDLGVDGLREQDPGDHARPSASTPSTVARRSPVARSPPSSGTTFMRDALRDVPVTEFSEPAPDRGRARRRADPRPARLRARVRACTRAAPAAGVYVEDVARPGGRRAHHHDHHRPTHRASTPRTTTHATATPTDAPPTERRRSVNRARRADQRPSASRSGLAAVGAGDELGAAVADRDAEEHRLRVEAQAARRRGWRRRAPHRRCSRAGRPGRPRPPARRAGCPATTRRR